MLMRVIKVGGRPQQDARLPEALAAAHRASPGSLVVVHGGGGEVSSLQRLYGVTAEFKSGRRVTSVLDLEIIRMALSGAANKRLVSALVGVGVPAVGISGEDAGLLTSRAVDLMEFGYVGRPAGVEIALLTHLCAGGYLPVVSPVSRNADPGDAVTLNVNGDDAAAAIASALEADELLLVTDVPGVVVQGEPVRSLDVDEARRLIDVGVARDGMQAKLEAALAALENGVCQVRISDITAIGLTNRGTIITRAASVCT